MRTVKWGNGRHSALQHEDAELPLALADKALRRGVAVPLTDERRKTLKGARGGYHPNLNALDIVDLDALDDPKAPYIGPDPVLRQSAFTVIDRSADERVLSIPSGRVA
jgi:hypothetical protein